MGCGLPKAYKTMTAHQDVCGRSLLEVSWDLPVDGSLLIGRLLLDNGIGLSLGRVVRSRSGATIYNFQGDQ